MGKISEIKNVDIENARNRKSSEKQNMIPISTSPPAVINMLSNQIRRNETMDANRRASLDYLQDLEKFVKQRMKDKMVLKIPDLVYDDRDDMVERLGDQGWYQHDWSERRLTREELSSALESMATLHAAGLAFRMSNKKNYEKQYPSLIPDLFTSN